MKNVYQFEAIKTDGSLCHLSHFENQALLIVNTASKCGFTDQYEELEEIQKKYMDQGFRVIAFPCNQFGKQEPATDEDIFGFCQHHYGISFQLMSKIEVNGKNTHPLYQFLKSSCPGILGSEAIKWNFTKFLIDKKGTPIKRFAPRTSPMEICNDIEKLL